MQGCTRTWDDQPASTVSETSRLCMLSFPTPCCKSCASLSLLAPRGWASFCCCSRSCCNRFEEQGEAAEELCKTSAANAALHTLITPLACHLACTVVCANISTCYHHSAAAAITADQPQVPFPEPRDMLSVRPCSCVCVGCQQEHVQTGVSLMLADAITGNSLSEIIKRMFVSVSSRVSWV